MGCGASNNTAGFGASNWVPALLPEISGALVPNAVQTPIFVIWTNHDSEPQRWYSRPPARQASTTQASNIRFTRWMQGTLWTIIWAQISETSSSQAAQNQLRISSLQGGHWGPLPHSARRWGHLPHLLRARWGAQPGTWTALALCGETRYGHMGSPHNSPNPSQPIAIHICWRDNFWQQNIYWHQEHIEQYIGL